MKKHGGRTSRPPRKADGTSALLSVRGTTYVRLPLVAIIGGALAIVVLAILFWSVKRLPDTKLQVKNPGDLEALLPSLTGLTHSSLDHGNAVEVLQNGDGFFPPLFRDIAAARAVVHIETFIWEDGRLARELAARLARKAREGVEVRLLVDASGTLLHQKVIVIDGVWSSVGSTNFDDRSFELNDEVNIGIIDREVGAQLRAAFAADLRHARQRTLPEWQNRGLGHKLRDGLAYLGRSPF